MRRELMIKYRIGLSQIVESLFFAEVQPTPAHVIQVFMDMYAGRRVTESIEECLFMFIPTAFRLKNIWVEQVDYFILHLVRCFICGVMWRCGWIFHSLLEPLLVPTTSCRQLLRLDAVDRRFVCRIFRMKFDASKSEPITFHFNPHRDAVRLESTAFEEFKIQWKGHASAI